MAKFVKVILFLLLTVAFHSIAGNVSTAKVVDEQERAITYAMRQHGEISAPDLPGSAVAGRRSGAASGCGYHVRHWRNRGCAR